jgi:hypothetical protein
MIVEGMHGPFAMPPVARRFNSPPGSATQGFRRWAEPLSPKSRGNEPNIRMHPVSFVSNAQKRNRPARKRHGGFVSFLQCKFIVKQRRAAETDRR